MMVGVIGGDEKDKRLHTARASGKEYMTASVVLYSNSGNKVKSSLFWCAFCLCELLQQNKQLCG